MLCFAVVLCCGGSVRPTDPSSRRCRCCRSGEGFRSIWRWSKSSFSLNPPRISLSLSASLDTWTGLSFLTLQSTRKMGNAMAMAMPHASRGAFLRNRCFGWATSSARYSCPTPNRYFSSCSDQWTPIIVSSTKHALLIPFFCPYAPGVEIAIGMAVGQFQIHSVQTGLHQISTRSFFLKSSKYFSGRVHGSCPDW